LKQFLNLLGRTEGSALEDSRKRFLDFLRSYSTRFLWLIREDRVFYRLRQG
jgi:hypothetical protein